MLKDRNELSPLEANVLWYIENRCYENPKSRVDIVLHIWLCVVDPKLVHSNYHANLLTRTIKKIKPYSPYAIISTNGGIYSTKKSSDAKLLRIAMGKLGYKMQGMLKEYNKIVATGQLSIEDIMEVE